jgi:outer membrane beta-barrel protein
MNIELKPVAILGNCSYCKRATDATARKNGMKRNNIFWRAFWAALLAFLPAVASAQQDGGMMSFSEEEAEQTPTEEPKAEASVGGSEDDLLSALGEGSTSGAPAAVEDQVVAQDHPIWAVQQVYALRARRLDFQPSFGLSMNDPYVQHQSVSLAATYYITEVLGVGVSFNYYGFLDAETDLNYSVSRATHQIVPINKYLLGAQLNFSYVPIYGKFALFREWILHWDVWVIGGGGFIMTRPEPVIDPEYRSFDFSTKFSFNVGLGGRLFLTRFAAIYLELRDYIYPEEIENRTNFQNVADRTNKNNWVEDGYKLTNNVTLHAGVSLFIPFTFDYKLPN